MELEREGSQDGSEALEDRDCSVDDFGDKAVAGTGGAVDDFMGRIGGEHNCSLECNALFPA